MKVKSILHVDDEAYEVDSISEELAEKGYEVEIFIWPNSAENPNKEGDYSLLPLFAKYDLILLDVIMGSGDLDRVDTDEGYTTGLAFHTQKIEPNFPRKPVFLISALPDGSYQTKARDYAQKHGMPYIQKSGETVTEILRHIASLEVGTEVSGKEER